MAAADVGAKGGKRRMRTSMKAFASKPSGAAGPRRTLFGASAPRRTFTKASASKASGAAAHRGASLGASASRRMRRRDRGPKTKGGTEEEFSEQWSDGFRERDDSTVWVKLPPDLESKQEVIDVFEETFGQVVHIHLNPDLKFGFVHLQDEEHAKAAIEVGTVEINGIQVDVRSAHKRTEKQKAEGHTDEGKQGDRRTDDSKKDDAMSNEDDAGENIDPMNDFFAESGTGINGGKGSKSTRATYEPIDASGPPMNDDKLGETVEALRVACIYSLEAHDSKMMLNEIGQDKLVLQHRKELPGRVSLLDVIRGFPTNFSLEDKGDGQFLVTLTSPDEADVAEIDAFVENCKRRSASKGKQEKGTGKGTDAYTGKKGSGSGHVRGAPAGSTSVIAGPLSDGFRMRDEHTVYVGNLPPTVQTKYDIGDAFSKMFGPVTHVHIQDDRKFGFVHFERVDSVAAALQRRVVEVCGGRCDIRPALEKGDKGNRKGGDKGLPDPFPVARRQHPGDRVMGGPPPARDMPQWPAMDHRRGPDRAPRDRFGRLLPPGPPEMGNVWQNHGPPRASSAHALGPPPAPPPGPAPGYPFDMGMGRSPFPPPAPHAAPPRPSKAPHLDDGPRLHAQPMPAEASRKRARPAPGPSARRPREDEPSARNTRPRY
mmetsp:Transcript_33428/g.92366  ORF Transcript_33428/g.92366 Transcript_33428/m.92366 type:complete len:655 (+) Transcript_33428:129-2093(+)